MLPRFLTVLATLSLLLFLVTAALWAWHPSPQHHWQIGSADGSHYVFTPRADGLLMLHAKAPEQAVGGMVLRRTDVTRLPYRSLLLATAMLPVLWTVKIIARKHASRGLHDDDLKPL